MFLRHMCGHHYFFEELMFSVQAIFLDAFVSYSRYCITIFEAVGTFYRNKKACLL